MRAVLGSIIILLLGFLLFAAFLSALAHGAVPKNNRANSLGVDQIYTNPNVYLFGGLLSGQVFRGGNGEFYTSVRVQPYNTMSIYDESVLFCDNQSQWFNGKRRPVIITYERKAHRMFRGIGCHELFSVFEVPTPTEE